MKRQADLGYMTHIQEIGILNKLLLDLKKQYLQMPHTPVTMERFDEGCKALAKIGQCRKQGLYK